MIVKWDLARTVTANRRTALPPSVDDLVEDRETVGLVATVALIPLLGGISLGPSWPALLSRDERPAAVEACFLRSHRET